MPDVRRSELLYRGLIDLGSQQVEGELRSDGELYAVFQGGTAITWLNSPAVGFIAGGMTLTGAPPNDPAATVTWRVPQEEKFSFKLENMTVKHPDKPNLKAATVQVSQFRVRITAAGGIDLSLMGAQVTMRNGKRVIEDGDDIYALESSGGCGCGGK